MNDMNDMIFYFIHLPFKKWCKTAQTLYNKHIQFFVFLEEHETTLCSRENVLVRWIFISSIHWLKNFFAARACRFLLISHLTPKAAGNTKILHSSVHSPFPPPIPPEIMPFHQCAAKNSDEKKTSPSLRYITSMAYFFRP